MSWASLFAIVSVPKLISLSNRKQATDWDQRGETKTSLWMGGEFSTPRWDRGSQVKLMLCLNGKLKLDALHRRALLGQEARAFEVLIWRWGALDRDFCAEAGEMPSTSLADRDGSFTGRSRKKKESILDFFFFLTRSRSSQIWYALKIVFLSPLLLAPTVWSKNGVCAGDVCWNHTIKNLRIMIRFLRFRRNFERIKWEMNIKKSLLIKDCITRMVSSVK